MEARGFKLEYVMEPCIYTSPSDDRSIAARSIVPSLVANGTKASRHTLKYFQL